MTNTPSRPTAAIAQSHTVRLVVLAILALMLQVPILIIAFLTGERADRRTSAAADIASKWGEQQVVTGPALVVPYTWTMRELVKETGHLVDRTETRRLVLLPDRLRVSGAITADTRSRGIFVVPVYTSQLQLQGTFSRDALASLALDPATIAWDRAILALGVTDARAIQERLSLTWNDRQIAFVPGAPGLDGVTAGIHAPVALTATATTDTFSFPLAINGSVGAFFSPFAMETTVDLTSNSPHPNFQGRWLPTQREITTSGFHATWTIPYLGRDFPQAWTSASAPGDAITKARFGVELTDPIDPYRLTERSVKYSLLFIMMTFAAVWLIEVMASVRVHPIQYVLIGAALCLFYLLELSLSEHLPFVMAYALASIAVIAMVAGYSRAILGTVRRMLVVAAGATTLYAYLYVVLTDEDTALLVGAIGLFVVLGLVMIVTRRIDWYRLGEREAV